MNGARKSSLKLWADGELDMQKPEDRDSAAGYDAVVSAEPDSVMKTRGRSASQIPIIFVTVFFDVYRDDGHEPADRTVVTGHRYA